MYIAAGSENGSMWVGVLIGGLVLLVGALGGGALLWVGGRFLARIPKVTFWRSVVAHVVAQLCASAASIGGVYAIRAAFGDPLLALLVGLAMGLVVTWWLIGMILRTTLGKAALAWLPTGVTAVILVMGGSTLLAMAQYKKVASTRARIVAVEEALDVYRSDMGGYPTEDEGGLKALVTRPAFEEESLAAKWRGPYLASAEWLEDVWGNELRYELLEEETDKGIRSVPRVWSVGPDCTEGTGDDLLTPLPSGPVSGM